MPFREDVPKDMCWMCGSIGTLGTEKNQNQCRVCQCISPGKYTGVPQGIFFKGDSRKYSTEPDHDCDATVMRNGFFRAECSCGYYSDRLSPHDALAALHNHINDVRARMRDAANERKRARRRVSLSQ